MRAYLQSLGYTILRWAEWCENHMEFTVITPSGEVVTAEAEWMLVPQSTVHGPRSAFQRSALHLVHSLAA